MKVILTETAEENLWQIYRYHADYDIDYADRFQSELSEFLFELLSSHPEMGTLYNPSQHVFCLVYDGRYNVYYVIRDALYSVCVLDGRVLLNLELADPDVDLPTTR